MDIKCYIAMIAAEFRTAEILPENSAWMACHFSCYGTGLTNLPAQLPKGAMIIVNDRTPPHGHDPERILDQLCQLAEATEPSCILLDLQRPEQVENKRIAEKLTGSLPCPVGVSALYANELDCPVFLDTPPPNKALDDWIKPWNGRDIWLEVAAETICATVTKDGCQISSACEPVPDIAYKDESLCSDYSVSILKDCATITIRRSAQQLFDLLSKTPGITKAVGLYQQLGAKFP